MTSDDGKGWFMPACKTRNTDIKSMYNLSIKGIGRRMQNRISA